MCVYGLGVGGRLESASDNHWNKSKPIVHTYDIDIFVCMFVFQILMQRVQPESRIRLHQHPDPSNHLKQKEKEKIRPLQGMVTN